MIELAPDLIAAHRTEADMVNEAVAALLAHDCWAISRMREGLAQAERGEFAQDADMDAFFARFDV
jgi:predicted transcriptional regulator